MVLAQANHCSKPCCDDQKAWVLPYCHQQLIVDILCCNIACIQWSTMHFVDKRRSTAGIMSVAPLESCLAQALLSSAQLSLHVGLAMQRCVGMSTEAIYWG